eukprot:5891466-Prymnesium_polylepis.1
MRPAKAKAPRTVSSSWRCARASSTTRPLTIMLDSGCTFHMHPRRADLLNARPCSDGITGLTEKVYCKWVGDLPVTATDKSG